MAHFFHNTKSLSAVIVLLYLVKTGIAAPFPENSPGRQPISAAARVAGENNGDEEKNKICRDFYNSSDYIYIPQLNKCELCGFACARSTEAYCKACATAGQPAPIGGESSGGGNVHGKGASQAGQNGVPVFGAVAGVLAIATVLGVVAYRKYRRRNGQREDGEQENNQEEMVPLSVQQPPVQESQPPLSSHPMTQDIPDGNIRKPTTETEV